MQHRALDRRLRSATCVCCFVGFLLWLAYGIASDNWAMIIPNIVAAIVSVATIAITLRYRPRA